MIKKLLFSSLTIVAMSMGAQNFSAMYPFTGVQSGTANTGTVDPTPVPSATGVTFGSFTAVGTPSVPAASGAFAFDTWGTGATNGNDVSFTGSLNPGQYYMVTLTPSAGYTINFNSISFNVARSSTGPRHWAVRGSLDSYSVNLNSSISPPNGNLSVVAGNVFFWNLDTYTVTSGKQERGSMVSLPAYTNQVNPVSFRFYAWDAEGAGGTFRLDTVTFNGTAAIISGENKFSFDLNANFRIYPNPSADGNTVIEANEGYSEIAVYNLNGQLIRKQEASSSEKIKLNMTTLNPGTYFVRMRSGDKISSQKLIVSPR